MLKTFFISKKARLVKPTKIQIGVFQKLHTPNTQECLSFRTGFGVGSSFFDEINTLTQYLLRVPIYCRNFSESCEIKTKLYNFISILLELRNKNPDIFFHYYNTLEFSVLWKEICAKYNSKIKEFGVQYELLITCK